MLREGKSYEAVARHYGINESYVRYIKKEEKTLGRQQQSILIRFNKFTISRISLIAGHFWNVTPAINEGLLYTNTTKLKS